MITININRLKSSKDEDIKYAEINTATYITDCLSDNEIALLKEKWNEKGGHKVIPWYKWVLQNTTLSVSCD